MRVLTSRGPLATKTAPARLLNTAPWLNEMLPVSQVASPALSSVPPSSTLEETLEIARPPSARTRPFPLKVPAVQVSGPPTDVVLPFTSVPPEMTNVALRAESLRSVREPPETSNAALLVLKQAKVSGFRAAEDGRSRVRIASGP